jgi:hypothetical protein
LSIQIHLGYPWFGLPSVLSHTHRIFVCNFRNDEKEYRSLKNIKVKELSEIEASKNNSLKKFGQFIPDLVKKIEIAHKQGRFHEKPRGPIGKGTLNKLSFLTCTFIFLPLDGGLLHPRVSPQQF